MQTPGTGFLLRSLCAPSLATLRQRRRTLKYDLLRTEDPRRVMSSMNLQGAPATGASTGSMEEGQKAPPRVFVSYSHDSPVHAQHVLDLAERLRKDGIDAWLDQYVVGTPAAGWPRWMLDRLDWADFVLVVCTGTYYRRFRGHEEPGKGKGADWEGKLITTEMYEAKSTTTKFAPVFLMVKTSNSSQSRFVIKLNTC
jgi:hypothetical protein